MEFDISSMRDPAVYDHAVQRIELIETHISWVILTGDYAYKIKKPVDFGFLDFSTLQKRRTCCEQELQLNRRMAPELYLDVVPISAMQGRPMLSGSGSAVEYAVKMAQFPQSSQLDRMLLDGALNADHVEAIAVMVADFHQSIEVAGDAVDFGTASTLFRPVEENFTQIREHLDTRQYADVLGDLEHWSRSEFERLEAVFEQRNRDGFVRECHGDMHLRNLVWLNDRPLAFDCIEFNPSLRWIDVISDIAFLLMDLHARAQPQLANRCLNVYLEATGDYAGLSVLPFYLCYRALVRAKVDALRLEQNGLSDSERGRSRKEFESYLDLAKGYTQQHTPKLIVMRGVSASGKSTVSGALLDAMGGIRIRSDVERKRLFNIDVTGAAAAEVDANIYSTHATRQTYTKLAELASGLIKAGYSVIVDAAFLAHEQRKQFQSLARRSGIAYAILDVQAPDELLRRRIMSRTGDVSDADIVVLEQQLRTRQPLQKDEHDYVISVNTAEVLKIDAVINAIDHITDPGRP